MVMMVMMVMVMMRMIFFWVGKRVDIDDRTGWDEWKKYMSEANSRATVKERGRERGKEER